MSGILIRVLALFVNSEHQRGKDMKAVFSKLKRLAYVGTSEKRVLFKVEEIEALGLGITEVQDLIIITPCANIPCLFKLMEGYYRLFYCHQSIQEALTALYICAMPLPDFKKFVDENLDDPHFSVVRRIVLGVMLDSSLRVDLNNPVIGNPCDEETKKKILRDWLQKILMHRKHNNTRKGRARLPWNMIKCSDIELCSLLNECGEGVSDIIAEHMTSVDFTKRVLKADSLHAVAHVLSQSKRISMANFGKVEMCDFENTELLTNCLVRCHHVRIRDLQLSNITKPLLDGSMNISRSFQEMRIEDGSQITNPHERKLEVEVLTLLGVASDDVLGEALDLLSDSFQSIRVGKSSLRIQFQDSCEGSKKISICDVRDDKGKYQAITEEDLSTIQRVLKLFHQKSIAEMTDGQPVEGDAASIRASELDHHREVAVEFQAVKLSEPVLNTLIKLFNKCKSVKIRNLQLSNTTEPLLHGLMNISSSFQKMQIKEGPQKMNPHGRELEVEVLNLLGVAQAPDDILGEALDLLSNASQRIRFENSCLLIKFEDDCEGNKKVSFQKEGTKKHTVEDLLLIQRAFQLSQLFECPQLKILNLSDYNHRPEDCRHIGEMVKTARVEDLNLKNCKLTTEHVSELKEGLKGYEGQLKKLNLRYNEVICTKLGEIVEMCKVEELDISVYSFEPPTAQDVENFIAALDSMRHQVRIKFTNKLRKGVEGSAEELRENILI